MKAAVAPAQFIATSDGELVENPRFFVTGQRKLKSLQRRLKQKAKGANRWLKQQQKVARYHEKLSRSRKDFQFKLAHQLCDRAQSIYAEDLNLQGLAKGMLGKHCLDAAWGQFLSILQFVAFKRGVYFQKVDAKGTSQTCPACGVITGKKELSERVNHCPECGYTTNRDVAAAQVVMLCGCAAVGHTVKQLAEGSTTGRP
ncbi:transposase [Synechococcus elongatus IITB4]|uniref:RNA-guided endonuclease InsQ/TnpB family protein n=1 Tax=Synechococcus elongatus TaxID=32046 RepID=UPI0030CC39FC